MPGQSDTDPTDPTKAGGGDPKNPAGPGEDGATTDPDGKEPVTQAELKAHKQELQELLAKQYQGIQSLVDRQSGNLKAALDPVNNLIASLRAQGVEISDAQAEGERNKAVTTALTGGPDELGPDGKPVQPGQKPGEPAPADEQTGMGKLAMDMMREQGVVISEKDTAELALIDQETKDPKVFMDSFQAALDAKVQRLAADPGGTGDDVTDGKPKGPGLQPRGKGTKPSNVLPDKMPGGGRTSSQNFLQAGYNVSDKFPSEE
jgi:hypothetical protein